MEYCLQCFQKLAGEEICPVCGFSQKEERLPQFLAAGAVVRGRCLIGRVLGQGGFGITYKAYDRELLRLVAIKEYFPAELAQRTGNANTVTAYRQEGIEGHFQHGKEKFLDEARTLAKFSDFPGIVRLYDWFEENGTAYIVMQFLEGIDLSAYLQGKGGRISCEEAKEILLPVVDVLTEVHKTGMIHRDISPQNIFITTAGQIKVIDFGAARAAALGEEKSRSVLLKPGYAPEEQYRTHGSQGSWTDVYALCATLYRMVTGLLPPDALERLHGEVLSLPDYLTPEVRYAIGKGMAVRAHERIQNMEELHGVLYSGAVPDGGQTVDAGGAGADVPAPAGRTVYRPRSRKQQNRKKGGAAAAVIASLSVVLILAMVAFMFYMLMKREPEEDGGINTTAAPAVTEEAYQPPEFSMVNASRKTTSTQSGRAYGAALAYDGKTDTAWNVPGGVGEWIELSADTLQQIKGIKILNGYTKYSPDYGMWIYYANSRPKEITVTFSDGTYLSHTLNDTFQAGNYDYQTIDFGGVKKTSFIRITVNSVYKGNKWNDCCITEIQPY